MNKNNLPNNLYELRKGAGLSQEDFAEKLGVSRQAVSKWERGEAYPDTENLIAISDMFGVTIDDLLNSDKIASDTYEEPKVDGDEEEQADEKEGSFRVNVGDKLKVNLNGAITVDDDDTKVKIDLGKGDIIVDDEDGRVKVDLGSSGITVNSDDGVRVQLGKHGIKINNNDDDDDDDDDDEESRSTWKYSMLYSVPYSIICAIAFLVLGFTMHAWNWAWTFFMTIPIYDSILDVIRKKRLSSFCYPVFVAFLYCLFGMLCSWWHPGWIIFVTIPVYYPIAEAIDRHTRSRRNR